SNSRGSAPLEHLSGQWLFVGANSFARHLSLALQYRRHAHAARRADRDQATTGAALGKLLGERTDDARASRRKRVSQRNAAALWIELGPIDAAERRGALQLRAAIFRRLPGLERAEHLGCKRFVNFVDIEILQRDTGAVEHRRHGVSGRHEQTLARTDQPGVVDRSDCRMREPGLDWDAVRLRPRFGREQNA